MKRLLVATGLISLAFACGDSNDKKDETVNPGFSLSKTDTAEKNWADGGINLNEEKLVLHTNYIPEGEAGSVSLPQCAKLDADMVIGKFICNSDSSVQDIKVKNVEQNCNLAGSESSTAASESLSTSNCETGKVTYFPLNVDLGHTIQDK